MRFCLTLDSIFQFMKISFFAHSTVIRSAWVVCFLSLAPFLFAQQTTQPGSYCGTDAVNARYLDEHPEARVASEAFEQLYQSILANPETLQRFRKSASVNPDDMGSAALKYTIPVVVHVIHNGGPENITDAQVRSAFPRINEDFRRMPETEGWGAGVDYQVEFELASKDPSGNAHSGINRIQSALTDHLLNSQQSALKNLSKWDQNKYLNIWIVKSINGNVLAYATYPVQGNNADDGVVCTYWCWGTTGAVDASRDLCRVPVHEIGHWLALAHPFESNSSSPSVTGCNGLPNASCTSQGDRVCDTPPVAAASFGNPARKNSCQEPGIDRPDRTRNYMDYTDDPYKDEFTVGQLMRSHLALENDISRRQLYTQNNMQAVGVGPYRLPEANFVALNRYPCVNTPVQFVDWSNGHASSWSWSFPGGTPATASVRNPSVTYAAPGTYDVTLTVTNLTGSSPAFSKTGYIVVTDQSITFPMKEDFSATTFPPAGWRVHNPDGGVTFVRNSAISAFGSTGGSARISQFTYRSYDHRDELHTPVLNFSGAVQPMLYFSVAYTPYATGLYSDTLEVYASDDCGGTWTQVFRMGGEDLMTNSAPQTTTFNPSATEWIVANADLSAYAGKNNVRIKFESVNGYGNNLYLDDIEFREPWAVNVQQDWLQDARAFVSPNPFSGNATLHVFSPKSEEVEVRLLDINGRVVKSFGSWMLTAGKNEMALDATGVAGGVYTALIQTPEGVARQVRLVITR